METPMLRRFSRRGLLKGIGAAAIAASVPTTGSASSDEVPLLEIEESAQGVAVPRNFLGLSYEKSELASGGFLSVNNDSLLPLLRALGPHGVIRIGGNSSDRMKVPPTRAALADLADLLRHLGWSLIYGLNLGTGSAAQAAEEAATVSEEMGPLLIAFQIGNEPDLYDRGLRSRSWNPGKFLVEWQRFADAITARVPDARFAGPDIGSQPGWMIPFTSAESSRIALLTCHYYSEGPARSPLVDISGMLNADVAFTKEIVEAELSAKRTGLPLRMTEANSVYGGGKPGVSDTLASAVWATNFLFELAEAGWQGINFHQGMSGAYAPIVRASGGDCVPRPLYYAMLLFAQAAPARMLPASGASSRGLRAYAMICHDERIRLAVINKDLGKAAHIAVRARTLGSEMVRLIASEPASRSATLARAGLQNVALSGPPESSIAVEVPRCSAALIDLGPAKAGSHAPTNVIAAAHSSG